VNEKKDREEDVELTVDKGKLPAIFFPGAAEHMR